MKRVTHRPPWLERLHKLHRARAYAQWERDVLAFLVEKARAKRASCMAGMVTYVDRPQL